MSEGVDVQELHGMLEVKNFKATCASITSETALGDAVKITRDDTVRCRVALVSDSAFGTDDKGFCVSIAWEATPAVGTKLKANPAAKMGVFLKRKLGCCPCIANFHVEFINTEHRHNISRQFEDFVAFEASSTQHVGWGPLSTGVNCGLVMLSDVLDPSKGWLHSGALRFNFKLELVVKDQFRSASSQATSPLATLSSDLESLLNSGNHADVTIAVAGETMHAHSQILMARSKVFASMLTLPMREAIEKIISVKDLSMTAVKAVITFMYSGRIDESLLKLDADALEILEAAHGYDVQSLVQLCVESLCLRFDVQTVAEWLRVADLIDNTVLKTKCLEFTRLHLAEVQVSESFANLVAVRPAVLAEILALVAPPAKRQRTSE